MTQNLKVLAQVDKVQFALRADEQVRPKLVRALHKFNRQLFVRALSAFFNNINFSISITDDQIDLFWIVWHRN